MRSCSFANTLTACSCIVNSTIYGHGTALGQADCHVPAYVGAILSGYTSASCVFLVVSFYLVGVQYSHFLTFAFRFSIPFVFILFFLLFSASFLQVLFCF